MLHALNIKNIRIIESATLEFHKQNNLIIGPNGSGKTTLLEAISILSTGKSFRTQRIQTLLRTNKKELAVAGAIKQETHSWHLEVTRSSDNKKTARLNGHQHSSTSELARVFPTMAICADSHHIFGQSASARRTVLDWGTFHQDEEYILIWQQYRRLLQQRNAALNEAKQRKDVKIWEEQLDKPAEQLHQKRSEHIALLKPMLFQTIEHLKLPQIDIKYKAGWDNTSPLSSILDKNYHYDKSRGFTTQGPHRADIAITIKDSNKQIQEAASNGQLKQYTTALRLAQIKALKQRNSQHITILIDDLAAALDKKNTKYLIEELKRTNTQVFMTTAEQDCPLEKRDDNTALFHVEHGRVLPAES